MCATRVPDLLTRVDSSRLTVGQLGTIALLILFQTAVPIVCGFQPQSSCYRTAFGAAPMRQLTRRLRICSTASSSGWTPLDRGSDGRSDGTGFAPN